MSIVDFSQDAKDHGCLHIAVVALGEACGPIVATVKEFLQTMTAVQLKKGNESSSVAFLRFLEALPRWATDGRGTRWEDFTAYKQIVGVLAIAQCHDNEDVPTVKSDFKRYCSKFKRTLCDSRCIVYGPRRSLTKGIDSRDGLHLIDCDVDHQAFEQEDLNVEGLEEVVTEFAQSIQATLKSRIGEFVKAYGGQGRLEVLKPLKTPFTIDTQPARTSKEPGQENEEFTAGEPRYPFAMAHSGS